MRQGEEEQRVAGTFFIQPALNALLIPITGREVSPDGSSGTYGAWKERKYGKYFAKKVPASHVEGKSHVGSVS